MSEPELYAVVYGFFADGLNSQNIWDICYAPSEDTQGRGYPDWVPEHTTLLRPPLATSRFVAGEWV